jgi:hypothetical protein
MTTPFYPKLKQGLLLTFLIFSLSAKAQSNKPEPIKFGKSDMADRQMKFYAKDSSADAVVLCDYGNTYYSYNSSRGMQVNYEHICRIKIFKKSAYDWATHGVGLYRSKSGSGREYMDKLKATTYNLENGKMVETKLGKDGIFEEKQSDTETLKKFTLPNVREGSIIEYSYVIVSDFEQSIPAWEFQKSIPTAMSEYRVSIPTYYYFRLQSQGYEPFAINENTPGGNSEFTTTDYRWVLKDAPAIKEEAYMTTIDDYVNKIDFDLAAITFPGQATKSFSVTWEDLATDVLKSERFGGELSRFGFLKDAAASIKAQAKDTLGRIALAYEFVRKNVKWNEHNGIFAENMVKKAYESKIGNDADINIMLVDLLRELDFNANPVLLSTRSHGRMLESYILLNKFNYTIAQVDIGGKDMLLDATDPLLKMGMLPMRCLNGIGRVITKDVKACRWVSLEATEKDSKTIILNLALNEEGQMTGSWDVYHNGYGGLLERRKISKDGKEKYIETFKKAVSGWEVPKIEVNYTTDLDKILEVKTEVKTESVAQVAGGRIYFKPLLTESQEKNPFKLTDRKFPVDMGTPIEEVFIATYTLPKGYVVEELPKGIRVNLPEDGGRFQFIVSATADGKIAVSSKTLLKKAQYFADEYDMLKQFVNQIIAKHAEQIVLKKQ